MMVMLLMRLNSPDHDDELEVLELYDDLLELELYDELLEDFDELLELDINIPL